MFINPYALYHYHYQLPNTQGLRLLHLAAYVNSSYAAQLLLQEGAISDSIDLNQRLPIHYLTWQSDGIGTLETLLNSYEKQGGKTKLAKVTVSKGGFEWN